MLSAEFKPNSADDDPDMIYLIANPEGMSSETNETTDELFVDAMPQTTLLCCWLISFIRFGILKHNGSRIAIMSITKMINRRVVRFKSTTEQLIITLGFIRIMHHLYPPNVCNNS